MSESNSSAIWYNSGDNTWSINNVSDIGSVGGVATEDGLGTDHCPYNVPNENWQAGWWYHDGGKWRQPNNVKHIKVQCLIGKLNM